MQQELDGRYQGKNVQFLAISTGDPDWYLMAFKKQLGVAFPWLTMDISVGTYFAEVYDQYHLGTNDGNVTIMVLDHDGIIRYRGDGHAGSSKEDIDYRFAFDLIGTLLEAQQTSALPDIGNQAGQRALDFTLNDVEEGDPVTLSDFFNQGKLILLSFWGTGCVECGSLVPGLFAQDLLDDYGPEKLTVLGIDQYSPIEVLKDFIKSAGITYPVVKDELGDVAWAYQASGEFVFLLLDANGVILYRGEDFDNTAVQILHERLGPLPARDDD